MNKQHLRITSFICYAALSIYIVISVFPLLWLFFSSFKTPQELTKNTVNLLPQAPTLYYYKRIFFEYKFFGNILNSLVISLSTTLIAIIVSSLAAYGIIRFYPRTGKLMTRFLVTTYMFPPILLAIPYSAIITNLGLINTHVGVIITYLSFSIPFAIWLLLGFFVKVPLEIEEAAMLDGASRFKIFYKIALPIAMPGIIATAIYTFINAWNEFLFALILINSSRKMPVSVGLYSLVGGEIIEWGDIMAASSLTILPSVIFFLIIQNKIASGLAQGSVK